MRLFFEPKENYILLWNNSIAKRQEEKPIQNFGLLRRRSKIPPLSAQTCHSAGGRGVPNNFFCIGIVTLG
jgi:hypothetical protein